MQLKMLEMVFVADEYALYLAKNGEQALQKAREIGPDLVLLDLMMPGMNGFEVCRQLRDDPALAEVPIIMITARSDRASFIKGLEMGADDLIAKPFDPMLLQARVKTIIRLNRYRRLLQERAKLQWVVEQTAEGYVSLDEAGLVVFANPRARSMLGLPAEDGGGSFPFLEVAKARFRLHPERFWEDWLNDEGKPARGYLVLPESEQSKALWLQTELLPIPPRSGERYFIRLADVTQQMAEHQLVGSFHDAISHKFQTPLAILDGTLETLADPRLPPSQREPLMESARENVSRLQGNIDGILGYLNAFEVGRESTPIGEIDAIFQASVADFDAIALSVDLDLSAVDEAAGIPLRRRELEQILRELIANAVKFHPEQKPQIEIGIKAESESLRIQCADNGLGVPQEALPNIWIPYFQIDRDFTGETPGVGVGLSLVAALVLNVGGRCRALPRTGKPGLLVQLEIPLLT